jgi:hypothetical protein
MTKARIGNYVYFDAGKQSMQLLPLLECLRFAVDWGRPVDCYLNTSAGGRGLLRRRPGLGNQRQRRQPRELVRRKRQSPVLRMDASTDQRSRSMRWLLPG